jgi:hypothetical protein
VFFDHIRNAEPRYIRNDSRSPRAQNHLHDDRLWRHRLHSASSFHSASSVVGAESRLIIQGSTDEILHELAGGVMDSGRAERIDFATGRALLGCTKGVVNRAALLGVLLAGSGALQKAQFNGDLQTALGAVEQAHANLELMPAFGGRLPVREAALTGGTATVYLIARRWLGSIDVPFSEQLNRERNVEFRLPPK